MPLLPPPLVPSPLLPFYRQPFARRYGGIFSYLFVRVTYTRTRQDCEINESRSLSLGSTPAGIKMDRRSLVFDDGVGSCSISHLKSTPYSTRKSHQPCPVIHLIFRSPEREEGGCTKSRKKRICWSAPFPCCPHYFTGSSSREIINVNSRLLRVLRVQIVYS